MVLAGGNVGFKETKNWARVIRKIEKSNFLCQFQIKTAEIINSYSKLEVMNQSYIEIDLI